MLEDSRSNLLQNPKPQVPRPKTKNPSPKTNTQLQNVCPASISRCSTIGPKLKTGKNVNAPTITITLTSNVENNGVVTGKVPSDGGTVFLLARFPAIANIGMIIKKRPISIAIPIVVFYQSVFAEIPAKAEDMIARCRACVREVVKAMPAVLQTLYACKPVQE